MAIGIQERYITKRVGHCDFFLGGFVFSFFLFANRCNLFLLDIEEYCNFHPKQKKKLYSFS
jgi:hypothetical protein